MYTEVGSGFSLYLNSVEIYHSLVRVSDAYKDTWIYYKKTLRNTELLDWHHKCALQEEQNDTLSFVAIVTLSASISLCHQKKKKLGTNIVPIFS